MGEAGGKTTAGAARRVIGPIALLLCLFSFAAHAAAADLTLSDYKMAGDATRMRVVLTFDEDPQPRWFLLRSPHRLVIDLPETAFAMEPDGLEPRGLITAVRYGNAGQGGSRIILATKGPFAVEKIDVLENESSDGYRLVADIAAASEPEFETALALQAATTGSTSAGKGDRLGEPKAKGRPFVVVVDAGHGGIDGGAEGLNGTVEKDVTLAFAKELRGKLAASGRYDVFLTREKDDFLRLDDRVRIARQHAADLFISIHADTIRHKGLRGATVYTVSDKASDAEAEATALRENLSDELAGIETDETEHEVADILVELIRRETHNFSIRFARSLLGELSSATELINNPHRSAGFKVLRAPDVPSVLLELGYLSNPKDEEQLRSPEWRSRAADSLVRAIDSFAQTKLGSAQ